MKIIFIKLIEIYQKYISPLKGRPTCIYVPTCSQYAIEALEKPCVAFVDGMMCSAAIYAGSYCDYIIANREDDRIGCVGTMIQIIDYPKSGQISTGEISVRVYADGSEEKNQDYEEALQGNIQMIKDDVLNPLNAKFVEAMKTNRALSDNTLLKGKNYFVKLTALAFMCSNRIS